MIFSLYLNDSSDVLNVSLGSPVRVRHLEVDELETDNVIGVVGDPVDNLPQVVSLQPFVVRYIGFELRHPVLKFDRSLES